MPHRLRRNLIDRYKNVSRSQVLLSKRGKVGGDQVIHKRLSGFYLKNLRSL